MHSDTKEIAEALNISVPACSCPLCQNMCYRSPCMGTPQDMLTLANNGFGEHLADTTWAAGIMMGLPVVDMVQLRYDKKRGCCCMLDENGLCRLHNLGLKPTEGVLSDMHKTIPQKSGLAMYKAILDKWTSPSNEKAIKNLYFITNKNNNQNG